LIVVNFGMQKVALRFFGYSEEQMLVNPRLIRNRITEDNFKAFPQNSDRFKLINEQRLRVASVPSGQYGLKIKSKGPFNNYVTLGVAGRGVSGMTVCDRGREGLIYCVLTHAACDRRQ
jgi:hypothetical protein